MWKGGRGVIFLPRIADADRNMTLPPLVSKMQIERGKERKRQREIAAKTPCCDSLLYIPPNLQRSKRSATERVCLTPWARPQPRAQRREAAARSSEQRAAQRAPETRRGRLVRCGVNPPCKNHV